MANRFDIAQTSFVIAAPVTTDEGWVVVAMDDLAEQEIEHSAFLRFEQGEFISVCLKMFRTKYVAWLPTQQIAVLVGDNGECCAVDSNGTEQDEFVTASPRNPRNTGHIRAAARCGEEIIAVGMQRQVYRRQASGSWIDMMQGLPLTPGQTSGFECVLPVSAQEIYAAGWHGELWLFDGTRWRQLDSLTNRIITSLCLGPDGDVLGCGQLGLVFRGRHDSWTVLGDQRIPEDLWSIAALNGHIFISALRRMYTLTEQGFELVDFDALGANSFGALMSAPNVIWSMGQKDFIAFDGMQWRKLA